MPKTGLDGEPDEISVVCAQVHLNGGQPAQSIDSNGVGMDSYRSKWAVEPE